MDDAYNPPADPNAAMPMPPSAYTEPGREHRRLRLDRAGAVIAVHYPADGE